MDPNNPTETSRLFTAIDVSRRAQRWMRVSRQKLIRDFVGPYYGSGEQGGNAEMTAVEQRGGMKTLVNLMSMTAEAYMQALAANRPRVLVTSRSSQHAPFAYRYQWAINETIKRNHVEDELRKVVLDAFFSVGIAKVFMDSAGAADFAGEWIDVGRPTVERVSLDCWFHDCTATDWKRIRYCGNFYRTPFRNLRDSNLYDQSVAKELRPTSKWDTQEGDATVEQMSQMTTGDKDEIEDHIDLMDVWLPDDGVICTWPWSTNLQKMAATPPLAIREWEGPEGGPYHMLGFSDVPDNVLPVAPASHLKDLSDLTNSILRKCARQAKRQRDVHVFESGNEDEARRVKEAGDGDWVQVNRNAKDAVNVIKLGGTDKGSLAFYLQADQIFSRAAGNLDAMAGLGPQSDTAAQDRMINEAVSAKESAMQGRVVRFTTDVVRTLGWLMWRDFTGVMTGEEDFGSTGLKVPMQWDHERMGQFLDYEFEIDPFSQPYRSPQQRVKQILGLVGEVYLPLMPLMQAQGKYLDLSYLTEMLAEMTGEPRLRNLIVSQEMPEQGGAVGGPPHDASQAPVTTRHSVRHNTGGGGDPRQQVIQQLMAQQDSGAA